jgi:hypothetical protein
LIGNVGIVIPPGNVKPLIVVDAVGGLDVVAPELVVALLKF